MPPRRRGRNLGVGPSGGFAFSPPSGNLLQWLPASQPQAPPTAATSVTTTSTSARVDAGATPLLGTRSDAPILQLRRRGLLQAALTAASTASSRSEALARLDADASASSAKASLQSIWKSWQTIHHTWFGLSVPATPLTVEKIKAVAAAMKAGGYASFANYGSRAKAEHISTFGLHGHHWSEELRFELAKANRSVTRGIGPGRRSLPLNIIELSKTHIDTAPMHEGGPVNPKAFGILGGFFLTREIEISLALASHVTLTGSSVTWNLPASKSDPKGIGEIRSWGCTCGQSSQPCCPFHEAEQHLELLHALFDDESGQLPPGLPLFPTCTGDTITKRAAVSTIVNLATKMGTRTCDDLGRHLFGGHSLRTGGAQLLAAHGLDQVQIQALARWHSPMLGHYAGLAPLLSITSEYNRRLPGSMESSCADAASSSKRAKASSTVQPGAI